MARGLLPGRGGTGTGDGMGVRRRDVLAAGVGSAIAGAGGARGQARRGGTVRISVDQAAAKLNPLVQRVGPEYLLGEMLYSGLTRLAPEMTAIPDLAASWSPRRRAGAVDVRAAARAALPRRQRRCTAADVAATFAAILDPDRRRRRAPTSARWSGWRRSTTHGALRAEGRLCRPAGGARLHQRQDRAGGGRLRATWRSWRARRWAPGRSGWCRSSRTRQIVVERNPAYCDPPRPYVDRVEVVVYPDPDARRPRRCCRATWT